MIVSRKRISAALGLLALAAAVPAFGAPPTRNQQTADAVAAVLRSHTGLARSFIQIETRQGLVTLGGTVATPALKAEAIARTKKVPGVIAVADRLRVSNDPRVRPVQYQPGMAPPAGQPAQVAMGGLFHHGNGNGNVAYDGAPMGGGMDGSMGYQGAGAAAGGTVATGPIQDGPLPEGPAMGGGTAAAMPGQPNYAWPSYAPYPNFSAVGYPTVYPWQAWPNIGPFYPYPEVPLDWRAVTLRWDDGLWWLDFRKNYTRPFFTPYPFGLFAY
jgi:hypothetical protein